MNAIERLQTSYCSPLAPARVITLSLRSADAFTSYAALRQLCSSGPCVRALTTRAYPYSPTSLHQPRLPSCTECVPEPYECPAAASNVHAHKLFVERVTVFKQRVEQEGANQ